MISQNYNLWKSCIFMIIREKYNWIPKIPTCFKWNQNSHSIFVSSLLFWIQIRHFVFQVGTGILLQACEYQIPKVFHLYPVCCKTCKLLSAILHLFIKKIAQVNLAIFFIQICLNRFYLIVEMEGLEPSSKQATQLLSTCLVFTLFSSWSRLKTTYFKPSFVEFRNVKEAITDLGLL